MPSRRRARFLLPGLALALLPLAALGTLAPSAPAATATPAPTRAAGDATSMWTPATGRLPATRGGHRRQIDPSDFRAYTLDGEALARTLAAAPRAGSKAARRGAAVEVVVPAPTGELPTFSVVESSVMEAGLQAKHPDIRTYVGNEPTTGDSISLVVTPTGVHASVRGDHPSWYVDPAYQDDDSLYLSYFGHALPAPEKAFVEPRLSKTTQRQVTGRATQRIGEGAGALVRERTYRLALLTDNTYAAYVAPNPTSDADSNSRVLAAKTLLVARVNQVYNDDLAIKMVLIDGTDELNLNTAAKMTGANGPCGATACFTASQASGCSSDTLTRNRLVVGLLAGAENFDVGHIGFGLNGGGIASLGVVGGSLKAQGCTGVPTPIGDIYAIDYVAHEIGHQFAGNHTFNGTQGSCSGGNRNAGTSVEPGSGTSVMAYAGICAADDLQPHTDPYFSQRSQAEIGALATSTPSNLSETLSVGLGAFNATDSFRLDFGGTQTSVIANGSTYTAASIRTAIQAVTGGTVTVSAFWGTGSFDTRGFNVAYAGTLANQNVVNPTVVPVSGTFTAVAGDIVKGGATTPGGSTVTTTANRNPTVTAPAAASIPLRTPFTLTGAGTDLDGDPLTYLWEQDNIGATAGAALISNTKARGPLFRVFGTYANVTAAGTLMYSSPGENLATSSPSRTFPDLSQVLAGTTNAATGACPTPGSGDYVSGTSGTLRNGPVLDCYSEFLPTASYIGSLSFRLTARDQRAVGGGTTYADVTLTPVAGTGPFLVTSQAASTSYAGGASVPVTWAVNGTNTATLAQNVRISLSTDGGLTFPTVLAASTPNDGSESIALPNVGTTTARLKIEAVGNYFFDVNEAAFTIVRQVISTTASPSISGTASPGSTLTADPGTWTPSGLTFAYQWYANNVVIAGATQPTFTPTDAQDGRFVSVLVTASRAGYDSVSAVSPSVRVVSTTIVNTVAPVISGSGAVGSTISLSTGSWNYDDLTYTYLWYADGAVIRGANRSTYVVVAGNSGKTITGRVTAARPGSNAVAVLSSNSVVPS